MLERTASPHKMVSSESGGILNLARDKTMLPVKPGPDAPKTSGQPSGGSLSYSDARASDRETAHADRRRPEETAPRGN